MPAPLIDPHGRTVRDLRISVTDRCNFRCTYCMPEDGVAWVPRQEILTFEEIERVARLCVERWGVRSIRLTGGEPTVRAGIADLVARLAALGVDLSLTTNGATLAGDGPASAVALRRAGLQRINVSLDSLRRDRFEEITRRDALPQVLAGIDAARAAGLDPVKVNCVAVRGVNDDEIGDFVDFGRRAGVEVRFIEWMPLDGDHSWSGGQVVPATEILARIAERTGVVPVARGAAPAERFAYLDGGGHVGVIASVTRPFCGDCDRIRLTAEGFLRNCLFAVREADLRGLLRAGAGDDALAGAIEAEVGRKWAGHAIGKVQFIRPARSMSQIGG